MYYSQENYSQKLRDEILKVIRLHDARISKSILVSKLIEFHQIQTDDQDVFKKATDNEIEKLKNEGHICEVKTVYSVKLLILTSFPKLEN